MIECWIFSNSEVQYNCFTYAVKCQQYELADEIFIRHEKIVEESFLQLMKQGTDFGKDGKDYIMMTNVADMMNLFSSKVLFSGYFFRSINFKLMSIFFEVNIDHLPPKSK